MLTATSFPVIDLHRTGHCIEAHRRAAGVSVRELQEYFGFEYPQAIYKWQHGDCLPTVDNLLALSRVLQVPMEDLLVYEDQEVILFLCLTGVRDSLNNCTLSFTHPPCGLRFEGCVLLSLLP